MLILRTIIARHHLSELYATSYPVASCFPPLFVILLLSTVYESKAYRYVTFFVLLCMLLASLFLPLTCSEYSQMKGSTSHAIQECH
jgi:hypothetical protein